MLKPNISNIIMKLARKRKMTPIQNSIIKLKKLDNTKNFYRKCSYKKQILKNVNNILSKENNRTEKLKKIKNSKLPKIKQTLNENSIYLDHFNPKNLIISKRHNKSLYYNKIDPLLNHHKQKIHKTFMQNSLKMTKNKFISNLKKQKSKFKYECQNQKFSNLRKIRNFNNKFAFRQKLSKIISNDSNLTKKEKKVFSKLKNILNNFYDIPMEFISFLSKKYVIEKQLGSGGFSTVQLIRERSTDRKFAAKIISLNFFEQKQIVLLRVFFFTFFNFKNEILSLHLLRNTKGIIKLEKILLSKNSIILLSEYKNEISLKKYLLQTFLSRIEKLSIFVKILYSVKKCHLYRIAHGDIKLENLIIDSDSNLQLIDFGLSAYLPESTTISNQRNGTLIYSSPEQLRDETYDRKFSNYFFG